MEKVEISFATPLRLVVQEAAPAAFPVFTFQAGPFFFKGGCMPGAVSPKAVEATMQVGSHATVSVEWKDTGGNTVKVDGPTHWASSNPGIVTCEVASGNPQIANLFAPGPIGESSIQATADADLGEGVRSVTATIKITVIGGEAVGGEIDFTPMGTGPQGTGAPKPRR